MEAFEGGKHMGDEVKPQRSTPKHGWQPRQAQGKPARKTTRASMSIGTRLRTARLYARQTQRELAARVTCSRGYISAIERGKRTPSSGILTLLAYHLEIPVPYLLGETEENLQTPEREIHTSGLLALPLSEEEQQAIEHLLGEVRGWLREGKSREALKLLSENPVPPLHFSQLYLIDWYCLTGWALALENKPRAALG